jgi:all-trans-retinol 13,14-reductase
MDQHYDVIVIGTGIGGLTIASLLSKLFQKKVLLLEQHF